MLTDLNILDQMIIEEAKVTITEYYDDYKVELRETECQNSQVSICHLPEETIVIDLDTYWSIDRIFTHNKGQCKRADFVIVSNSDEKVIIYIEIKKSDDLKKDIIKQLTGAQCFVKFCQGVGKAKAFWDKPDFLEGYNHRYVSFVNLSIHKKATRPSPNQGNHDCPERMLKISSPKHLVFKSLI